MSTRYTKCEKKIVGSLYKRTSSLTKGIRFVKATIGVLLKRVQRGIYIESWGSPHKNMRTGYGSFRVLNKIPSPEVTNFPDRKFLSILKITTRIYKKKFFERTKRELWFTKISEVKFYITLVRFHTEIKIIFVSLLRIRTP